MVRYKFDKLKIIGIIIFLLVSGFLFCKPYSTASKWYKAKKCGVRSEAVVTNIEHYYIDDSKHTELNINYIYEGKEYSQITEIYKNKVRVGDKMEIVINPQNPSEIVVNPISELILEMIIATLFGAGSFLYLYLELKNRKYINGLIDADMYVIAEYDRETESGTRVNNVRYTTSVFIYQNGYEVIEFMSKPHHPNKVMFTNGDTARVYVDLNGDRKKYYVVV